MKIALIAMAAALTFAAPANADWSLFEGQSFPEQTLDEKYALPTAGWDVRVYEWTPKGSADTACIMVFAEKGPVGMQCFAKKTNGGL
jgi:hypothetical protein